MGSWFGVLVWDLGLGSWFWILVLDLGLGSWFGILVLDLGFGSWFGWLGWLAWLAGLVGLPGLKFARGTGWPELGELSGAQLLLLPFKLLSKSPSRDPWRDP